jgi:hypothetical protein
MASDRTDFDTRLAEAAKAVVLRWETPLWKEAVHTAVYINRLSNALDARTAAASEGRQAEPTDEDIWRNDAIMAANASAGLPMPVLGLLVRAAVREFAASSADPGHATVSARFARLYGIVRRIRWTDFGKPAVTDEAGSAAALGDLCAYLFNDGIDQAVARAAAPSGAPPDNNAQENPVVIRGAGEQPGPDPKPEPVGANSMADDPEKVRVACISLDGATLIVRASEMQKHVDDSLDDNDDETTYTVTFKNMPRAEFEALGDFNGF